MARRSGERPAARTELGHRLSTALASAAVRTGGPPLESRDVGNALLFHPRGFVDSRALSFAERLAADPQHTLVVLDLPASPAEAVWETVARALDRRGDSFRLVLGRGTREDVKHTAQWLADRLGRLVLAPDGAVLPAAGGALFVPADHGLGWLRYRPNSSSHPDSRRFPKPQWEFSVPDRIQPTGAGGMVEPLPGGVWIRGTWEDGAAGATTHRQQLVDLLVGDTDLIAVAIGSPGTSALPLEEISAFWNTLPTSARPLVRFIPFGPIAVPAGAPLGQTLADLLGQRIAVYAGIPAPGADGDATEVRTLQRNGTLGWRPYADEFGFTPRSHSGGLAVPPVPLNTRVPVGAISAVAPGVYQYAADVVLEIVQSGLWVRPSVEPRDGHAVRSAPADPAYPVVLYEDSDPMAADRMRITANELLRGLDPSFGERSRIVPASEAGRFPYGYPLPTAAPELTVDQGPSLAGPGPAGGRVLADPATGQGALPPSSGDRGMWTDEPQSAGLPGPDPEARPTGPAAPAHGPGPALPRWESSAPPVTGPLTSQKDFGGPEWQPAAPPTARSVSGPDLPAAPTVAARDHAPQVPRPPAPPAPGPPAPPPVPAARAVPQVPPPPAPPAPVPPAPTAPPPLSESADPAVPVPAPSADPAVPVPAPSADPPPTVPDVPVQPDLSAPTPPARTDPQPAAPMPGFPRIRLEASTPQSVAPGAQPPAGTGTGPRPGTGAGPEPGAGPGGGPRPEPAAVPGPLPGGPEPVHGDVPRAQPEPTAAASVMPPEKGLERERGWLRRSLGERFDTAAGFAQRVLSESPGLHTGPRNSASDALSDLAAVRLYLTGATAAIDAAIRAGTAGPHVPLARCAAGGLRRLPSYRGPAMLRATLSPAERAWYREGRVLREHSFLAALSGVRRGLPGDTDVLVWSLTARRTSMLVPEIPDRVLFAPGTGFKVLSSVDGARPVVMLREMSAAEFDEHGRVDDVRVPLDEIALAGLQQIHTLWQQAEDDADSQAGDPLPEEHADAFRAPPGLLQNPAATPPQPMSTAPVPEKGATP